MLTDNFTTLPSDVSHNILTIIINNGTMKEAALAALTCKAAHKKWTGTLNVLFQDMPKFVVYLDNVKTTVELQLNASTSTTFIHALVHRQLNVKHMWNILQPSMEVNLPKSYELKIKLVSLLPTYEEHFYLQLSIMRTSILTEFCSLLGSDCKNAVMEIDLKKISLNASWSQNCRNAGCNA